MTVAASSRIDLLDRYRVPYVIEQRNDELAIRIARRDQSGVELISVKAPPEEAEQLYAFDGCVLYAAIADRARVDAALAGTGLDWREETAILDASGVKRSAVLRGSNGSVCLPFSIDAPLDALFSERYLPPAGAVAGIVRRGYYLMRPLLPRRLQLAVRRRARRLQDRASIPSWPIETSLHRLEALLLELIQEVAGEPLPWLSPWPAPYSWALVLTHDVERKVGYANVDAVRAIERLHNLRSAWYFVPERDYRVDERLLEELRGSDCEICLHGLRHDGRDLSPGVFEERLPTMRRYAEQWGARGFRGPSTHRDRDRLQQLGMEHDSSWSDVARYEPQPGGCCSWFPFFIGEPIELPITLPQDHTLFEVLREDPETVWLYKSEFLRKHGGMALMITHPDYLLDKERLAVYERFIASQATDQTVWHALPREVVAWWRRRATSHIERRGGEWIVVGPAAAEARIRLDLPLLPPVSPSASHIAAASANGS